MTASVLVLVIGLVDIVRSGRTQRLARAGTAAVLVTVGALAVLGLGVPLWHVLGCALLAICWAGAMPTDPARRQRVWPALSLLAVVACVAIASPASAGSSGFLLAAYERVTHPALDSVTPATVLAALAVLVFLTQSANLITRAAIGLVQPHDGAALTIHGAPSSAAASSVTATTVNSGSITASGPDGAQATAAADTGSSWDLRIGRRRLASVDRRNSTVDAATPPASPLKGGRLIGPLERYLIVGAALVGAYPVIACLLAAKGIVRFPEISADRGVGSAAETFLIGSLTSWTISAAAILYLVATSAI